MKLTNRKHESSGSRWKYDILEGKVNGTVCELNFAKAQSYENPNKNTTIAHYDIDCGIWNGQAGNNGFDYTGFNFNEITCFKGKTYQVKEFLKEHNFVFDFDKREWVRNKEDRKNIAKNYIKDCIENNDIEKLNSLLDNKEYFIDYCMEGYIEFFKETSEDNKQFLIERLEEANERAK